MESINSCASTVVPCLACSSASADHSWAECDGELFGVVNVFSPLMARKARQGVCNDIVSSFNIMQYWLKLLQVEALQYSFQVEIGVCLVLMIRVDVKLLASKEHCLELFESFIDRQQFVFNCCVIVLSLIQLVRIEGDQAIILHYHCTQLQATCVHAHMECFVMIWKTEHDVMGNDCFHGIECLLHLRCPFQCAFVAYHCCQWCKNMRSLLKHVAVIRDCSNE
jgi:hypothetical protein